ncbi:MAG: glycosyltransferase family 1 protein [Clostridiales bacterium]|nr:glycosyltransferase family 1 protein [Clostridiales bacterium]
MEPIRVLHEVTRMDAAGLETLLMNIYRNIDREKVQFDFMLHRELGGFYDDEILKLGGKIYPGLPFNPLKHNKYMNSISKLLDEHKEEYRIIHAHNDYSMFTLRCAKEIGIPIRIAHSHNSKPVFNLKKDIFRRYNNKHIKEYSTHLFACSRIAAEWVYGKEAYNRGQVKIIKNGIEPQRFIYNEEKRKEIRKSLGLKDELLIGHIGRFDKQKNHKFLIEVFNEVCKKNPNSKLLLIGKGDLEIEIRKQVQNLGIYDKVIFLGVVSNVNEYLQAMDVFLFPSLYEGLGIVVIEAQAAALKCIVSNAVPNEAMITDYMQVVPLAESAENWAEILLNTCKPYIRSDTSKLITESGFNIKAVAKEMEQFYLDCFMRVK